ncbi:GTP 3',8-cyclase MoaA [Thermodesulfobacteriota bacterium]
MVHNDGLPGASRLSKDSMIDDSFQGNLDPHRRPVTYLRVSVTDRCNLRCLYCTPVRNLKLIRHEEILSYEEILTVIRAAAKIGIRKIRVTGGEPLVRKDVSELVRAIARTDGIQDVGLTTNGVFLKDKASSLREAGLRRVNVSLDTLDPGKFRWITGRDRQRDVLEGLEVVEALGYNPIKINVVAIRGVNDDEIEQFARLTLERPFTVRFIEYMPIGRDHMHLEESYIPCQEIKDRVERIAPLLHLSPGPLDGPSEKYRFAGAHGEIGFISAVSRHFCQTCNRLRLTADGKLRPCLLSDHELEVKSLLRRGSSEKDLIHRLLESIASKPEGHNMHEASAVGCMKGMSSIGG